ncbi:MAG: dienelactone hydrolase family protein [Gammaproteobacteria bacterium]|nr:dienelactone hydrolase family protein [Gammaproteobacteria bacterium]
MNNLSHQRGFVKVIATIFAVLSMSTYAEESEIPDSILGLADEPRGVSFNYFEDAQGYLAEPTGEGPHGSVILIHEWNGVVDRIRQVADSFAAEGYVALAADLYSGRTGSNPRENMALVRETLANPDQIVANLDAAATYLRDREDTNDKVATIGWCYGGGVALSYALGGEHHEGTAIFYGRLIADPEQLKHLDHEIYGTFGALDRGPSVEQVNAFVAALRKANIPNDVHIYDPVGHGFWLYVDRDEENAREPATHAWHRLKDYLDRTISD